MMQRVPFPLLSATDNIGADLTQNDWGGVLLSTMSHMDGEAKKGETQWTSFLLLTS